MLTVHVRVCWMCVQEFADEVQLRRSRLPPEPASSDAARTVLISLRLPSGERLERRFNNTDQLQVHGNIHVPSTLAIDVHAVGR